jgi:hypothetical protein
MTRRFKAFLAAAAVLALPVASWAAETVASGCCPCCR